LPTTQGIYMAATIEKLIALCKRRGFVYQSAEIYGGLNGVYDFGPMGSLLKENIRAAWRNSMNQANLDIVYLEGSLLGSASVWEASGHVQNFNDPMVDCLSCKHRYRTDDIILEKPCPHCGNKNWTPSRQFNMMFKTQLGAAADATSIAYLRPETAQSIFVNFKNVLSTTRVKIPFGIAQIGKAFRNEITPKQFLFRMREFEQMEIEWFCQPQDASKFFIMWQELRMSFYKSLGINEKNLRLRTHEKTELAHYSKQCVDVEYEFPFGFKEIEGIADRADFDLSQHAKHSNKDLAVFDETTQSSFTPHIVECSVGVDRLFLTLLFDSYDEDTIEGETRIVLRFAPAIAPIKAAFFPLTKTQIAPMREIFSRMKQCGYAIQYDDTGSIGKRYRRQDEIGTPYCFTYDFDSTNDHMVTIRHRDTTHQERISIDHIASYLNTINKT
jgi:glycyl-tRNA synthetase